MRLYRQSHTSYKTPARRRYLKIDMNVSELFAVSPKLKLLAVRRKLPPSWNQIIAWLKEWKRLKNCGFVPDYRFLKPVEIVLAIP